MDSLLFSKYTRFLELDLWFSLFRRGYCADWGVFCSLTSNSPPPVQSVFSHWLFHLPDLTVWIREAIRLKTRERRSPMDPLPPIVDVSSRQLPSSLSLDIDGLAPSNQNSPPLNNTEQVGADLLDEHLDLLERTLPADTDFADLTETVVPLASILLDRGDMQSVTRAHGALCEVSNMGVWTVESSDSVMHGLTDEGLEGITGTATHGAGVLDSPPPAPPVVAKKKSPPGSSAQ